MRNLILGLIASFAFISTADAQCDATFTQANIACDSVWFIPASTGSQYTYLWDFGDGNTSTDASPAHTFLSDGAYTVMLVISDTIAPCNSAYTVVVTINCAGSCTLNPVITHNVNPSNCEVTLVSSVFGGTPPYTYFWNFGDGNTSTDANPIHQYPNNSTWLACLSVTDAVGCTVDSTCMTITVACTPASCDPAFTHNLIGCDSAQFFPVSVGSQYTYFWDFGDGGTSTDANPIHDFADGTYVVSLLLEDTIAGCITTGVLTIVIDCAFTPCTTMGAFDWNVDSVNCDVQFVSTAFGGTYPYTFFWQFGDGTTSTDPHPLHTYPNNSTWTPCLTITDANGCDITMCDVVSVACSPTSCDAQFTFTHLNCSDVIFSPFSSGPQYTYLWDFGDGNTSTDQVPTHTFADGVHIVTLTVNDTLSGCSDTWLLTIVTDCGSACTVNALFTHNLDFGNCNVFFVSSAWGGQAPYTYYWDFGDGNTSSDANPTHQYPNGSTWTPCLTVTDANGCDTTICYALTVSCTPNNCDPNFTYSFISCDSVLFIPANPGGPYNWMWDFGDGNTSTDAMPTHSFGNGVWTVVLSIADTITGCNDALTQLITINCGVTQCNLSGAISWAVDSTDCSVQFVSTAFGGPPPYTYYWNFGDGNTSTDPHPNHTYPNNSTWTPCLTITDDNGCDTTICDVVNVGCNPVSCDAAFNPSYVSCSDLTFFTASTGAQFTHFWDFGDGNTSTDPTPTHTFADGDYIVWHYIEDTLTGCSDSTLMTITIFCGNTCTINAAFNPILNFSNCTVSFTSTAWGGQAPYTYYWDFGDGTTSTQAHPVHQYANASVATPCLTVTDANGCDTTVCQVLTVSCNSVNCNATYTSTHVACDSVWFIPATSDSSYQYLWDFGDGNTSTDIDPVHHFTSNGTYTVVLYISDSLSGCSHAYTTIVQVNCGASPCSVQAVTTWLTDSADCSVWMIVSAWGGTAPYSYYWDFGDGSTSNVVDPVHTYNGPGAWTPCVTVTDANGCDTTVCMVVIPQCSVGINENIEFNLAVYPNPSNGVFNVLLPNDAMIRVFDLSGKLIYEDDSQKADGLINIDLSSVTDGVYILHVTTEFGIATEKLIKR